jgi:hypothetical protein
MFVKFFKLGVRNRNGRIYSKSSFSKIPETIPLYEFYSTVVNIEENNLIGQLYNIREEDGFICCDVVVSKSFKSDLLNKKALICSSGFGDLDENTGIIRNYVMESSFVSPWSSFSEWYEIYNDIIPNKQLEFDF